MCTESLKKQTKYLWCLESQEPVGYHEYDGHIVCAYTKKDALTYNLIVRETKIVKIGTASQKTPLGRVLDSFRAG
jgi:hypothetical protein